LFTQKWLTGAERKEEKGLSNKKRLIIKEPTPRVKKR
jgi:hypothetical protein